MILDDFYSQKNITVLKNILHNDLKKKIFKIFQN